MKRILSGLVAAVLTAVSMNTAAHAEVTELRAARQYGLSTLPLMIMEDAGLIEKHARQAGLPDLKVTWVQLGGPAAMNEGLISGDLHFGAGGAPALITLWARTKGTANEVRGVGAVLDMPMELVTTNPNLKSIRDLTKNDKIAVTSIKVSNQALLLQMEAAKEFGDVNYEKLDPLTVSLPHPDAMSLLLSGRSGITAHFSAMPFQSQELRNPGVRKLLSSYDVLGGPASNTVAFTTKKFHDANPKAYGAFVAALQEGIEIINKDKPAAAATYKRITGTKETLEELTAMLNDPQVEMTMTPHQTLKMASFMHKTNRIKHLPSSWTEMFFENVHRLPGS
jgi:NitT/TauT family transport system substrate-binding protein